MTVKEILAKARAEIGTAEEPLGSNRIKYNIEYWGERPNYEGLPWCVVFLWWCFKGSGLFPKMAHCDGVMSYAKQYGRWLYNSDLQSLQPGDCVIYDYDYNGSGDHIGLVEDVDGDKLMTIEGNYGDKVNRVERSILRSQILGAFRPDYEKEKENGDSDNVFCGDGDSAGGDSAADTLTPVTVRYGSKGTCVYLLQALLKLRGHECGAIDGELGPATQAALTAYQIDTGLEADGICGPLTWAKLFGKEE